MGGVSCEQLGPFLRILVHIIKFIQWAVPILLIALSTFDFLKGMGAKDDKAVAAAKENFGKRLIYAVIIFFVPVIVSMLFKVLGKSYTSDELGNVVEWFRCFNFYY